MKRFQNIIRKRACFVITAPLPKERIVFVEYPTINALCRMR